MSPSNPHRRQAHFFSVRILTLLSAVVAFGLLAASSASASYEQVGCFAGQFTGLKESCKPKQKEESFGEEVQLGGVSGMAVNSTGAGAVTPGTVYTVNWGKGARVAMFEPKADGSLTFIEAWQISPSPLESYERCGVPAGLTPCTPSVEEGSARALDVGVDPTTGNVYVLNAAEGSIPGRLLISEYTPDGSELITRFGERAGEGKTTAESPDKIHASPQANGMAVDAAGDVYVYDLNDSDNFYHRLMVFRPQTPGDYEHYVYAGQEHDIAAGFEGQGLQPTAPALDNHGHIYTVPSIQYIQEYDLSNPSAPPICSFEFPKGGVYAMTVNPETGEVFFSSYRDKKIHRLAPCSGGTFKETESFGVAPERGEIWAMGFDPARKVDPTRSPGTLYAGAGGPVPSGGGKGEPGQSALGYVFAQVQEIPPEVLSESVAQVTQGTATIGAEVNPNGSETRYAFQYLTQAAYEEAGDSFTGAVETPVGGAVLGNESKPSSAAAPLRGLSSDTEYRFRIVVTSHCSAAEPEKVCEDSGVPRRFRTFPAEAPGLSDHRAWELVSPAEKHGGQVYVADQRVGTCGELECKPGTSNAHPMQSAPDGEAVAYTGAPFVQGQGGVAENEYVSRRNEKTGWQTTNLTPQVLTTGAGYQAFDASLTQGVMAQFRGSALSPEAPSDMANLYQQPFADPTSISSFLTQEPSNRSGNGPNEFHLSFAGGSADFSKLFFAANDALTEATPFAPEAVDGGPSENNLYELSEGQLHLVNVLPGNTETSPGSALGAANTQGTTPGSVSSHVISSDGLRVFWTSASGQLYVREGGETTKEIPDSGKFLSASADGSKVLLSDGHLYDLETETTTDLTEGKGGFQGIAGQSEDLSTIYFVDSAALASGAEDRVCESASESKHPAQFKEEEEGMTPAGFGCNLYAFHEGETSFVATLQAEDNSASAATSAADWRVQPTIRTAEASPDGNYLAFLSRVSLTGYDGRGPCEKRPDGIRVIPCNEAFLYDSATGEVHCASCNPTNVSPLGATFLRQIAGTRPPALPQPRYLTNSGRLYFDSRDSLSPTDTNEGVEDVYQYEPPGIGTCERAAGCVNLISAGTGAVDSNFLSMSEDGRDIFFTTRDQLALKDKDELFDLYDARENGGIPSESEVARTECQGEACQGVVSAPNDPTPASSTFEGAGNVNEAKAKKKAKKHKKAHKKKHAHKRAAKHNRGGAK